MIVVIKEEIKAKTVDVYAKVFPVNSVSAIKPIAEHKQPSENKAKEDKDFADLLAFEEKNIEAKKNNTHREESEEVTCRYTGSMNYYNKNAAEMYFYLTRATTDIRG